MKQEVLLAIVAKLISEEVSQIKGIRGIRGPRGQDFIFAENKEEINLQIQSHIDSKDLKLKFEDLSEDDKESLRGLRGRPGQDGKDFNWFEHEEQIKNIFEEKKDLFELKFSELTAEELESLKGQDGKDFVFEDNKPAIIDCIADIFLEIKDQFKLRFSDLTEEEKQELIPEVDEEKLKLKFEDLTADEIAQLRGPRGQRGKEGKDFSFEENKAEIDSLVKDHVSEISNTLKLKFSDISDEEKDSLKLKFEDLKAEEISLLRGPRGQRGRAGLNGDDGRGWLTDKSKAVEGDFFLEANGDCVCFQGGQWNFLTNLVGKPGQMGLPGKDAKEVDLSAVAKLIKVENGIDGIDGLDAPRIADIQVSQRGFTDEVSLIFIFDDGTRVETRKIRLPQTIIQQSFGVSGLNSYNVSVDGGLPSKDNIFGFDGNGDLNFRLMGGVA